MIWDNLAQGRKDDATSIVVSAAASSASIENGTTQPGSEVVKEFASHYGDKTKQDELEQLANNATICFLADVAEDFLGPENRKGVLQCGHKQRDKKTSAAEQLRTARF